jgi:transposase
VEETIMSQLIRIGMDTSKKVFQLHGVDADERVVLSRKLSRHQMIRFFTNLAPTVIGIEACGASHHWARTLGALGHEVRLMAPQLVKPYVRRSKNDAADAEALCEAMSRPTMRFVPVKTVEQQAALMLVGMRERLIGRRTQLANSIRGYAAEFGVTAPAGLSRVAPFLQKIASEETLPPLARDLFAQMAEEYEVLMEQIRELDKKLATWHRSQEVSRRLSGIPGIGPLAAALLLMKAPDPHLFRSGRDFAAWIGLTPRDHSSGGKVRHGGITRAGDSRPEKHAGGWRDHRAPACQAERTEPSRHAVASQSSEQKEAETRCCGSGQQDGTHCMEADDQRRNISQTGGCCCAGSGSRLLTRLANTMHGKRT